MNSAQQSLLKTLHRQQNGSVKPAHKYGPKFPMAPEMACNFGPYLWAQNIPQPQNCAPHHNMKLLKKWSGLLICFGSKLHHQTWVLCCVHCLQIICNVINPIQANISMQHNDCLILEANSVWAEFIASSSAMSRKIRLPTILFNHMTDGMVTPRGLLKHSGRRSEYLVHICHRKGISYVPKHWKTSGTGSTGKCKTSMLSSKSSHLRKKAESQHQNWINLTSLRHRLGIPSTLFTFQLHRIINY